jgi:hypothetical protein
MEEAKLALEWMRASGQSVVKKIVVVADENAANYRFGGNLIGRFMTTALFPTLIDREFAFADGFAAAWLVSHALP